MRARVIIVCAVALVACAALGRVLASSTHSNSIGQILYTAANRYEPLAWMQGGERFPLGATIVLNDGTHSQPLVPGFFATADPSVSFDGSSLLFAGKKSASAPWQIWEVSLPAGVPRQVVSTPEDAVRPLYLPENGVVYAHKRGGRFVIESVPLSGGQPLQITYAPGNTLPTDVLRDGRILFQAGYPLGTADKPEIYTVYSDGSGVESYRCDHALARYSARQINNGDILFTHGRGLSKFTSPLAHELSIPAPTGEYAGDVVETPSGELLLSWRADATSAFELKRWKPGANTLTSLAATRGMNLIQPTLVQPRTTPNRHPSGLHDWTAANLMALNSYTSKYRFVKGSIASVRIYTQDRSARPKVLGTAPVEKDGSFYIHVPGDRPLKFELLDSAGKTLKRQNGWMWTRAGEQRICVGCHSGPERAPDNAIPATLLRSTTPVDMTTDAANPHVGGH